MSWKYEKGENVIKYIQRNLINLTNFSESVEPWSGPQELREQNEKKNQTQFGRKMFLPFLMQCHSSLQIVPFLHLFCEKGPFATRNCFLASKVTVYSSGYIYRPSQDKTKCTIAIQWVLLLLWGRGNVMTTHSSPLEVTTTNDGRKKCRFHLQLFPVIYGLRESLGIFEGQRPAPTVVH